ncbi:hypothetical protein HAX54_052127 [Datura stramonium]|uniref:Kinesin motor domain-containing protein n=2 Tax=Datura stramonium TaxID=4076 RepID=A0ABS8RRL6_DATST|nr:hypothetical protein [Datura stramonium]
MGTMGAGDEVAAKEGGGREERILVSVRLRPLNDKEILRNDVSDWECINDTTIIYKNVNLSLSERSMYPSAYTFDRVFRSNCSTRQHSSWALDDPEKGQLLRSSRGNIEGLEPCIQLLSICESSETDRRDCTERDQLQTIESSAREYLGRDNSSSLSATVNFVDLAGSRRASQSLSAGTRLKESCHINHSL